MIRIILFLLVSCLSASAQSGKATIQSGNVTPGHATCWTTNGIVQDCGTAAVPFLTSIGTVGQGQTICAWSALSTAPGSQKLCFGVSDSTGASLVIQNFGIDTPQPFSIVLNGTTYQFPYTVGGIVGPGTTVVGDLAVWNNTVGTLLADVSSAGYSSNVLNAQTSNYTVAATDCGKTIQAGTGSTGFFTVTVPSVSGFPGTCAVTIVNGDTARGKYISGLVFSAYNILWPKQSIAIGIVNGAWAALSVPSRWKLSATTTFQANSTSGSDTLGATDCLATGAAACATITRAAKIICDQIELNGQQVNIAPPSGISQVENVNLCNYVSGSFVATTTNPAILGNNGSPATFAIVPTSGIAVLSVSVTTPWTLSGLSIGGGGVDTCIESDINSLIYIRSVIFNNCNSVINAFYDGKVEALSGTDTISGTAYVVIANTEFGGQFLAQTVTITCTSSPTVGVFAQATSNSVQNWSTVTFSGCSGVSNTSNSTATTGGGIYLNGVTLPGGGSTTTTSPGWKG